MDNPLISVIVPCYKQAHFLDEALQSVLEQTYTNWECIIVNDGSPDDTEAIAQKWLKKDSRFKYIYKENGGLSSARNAGLGLAKGVFIQFLDSDDYLDPDKISKSINSIRNLKTDNIVVSNFKFFKNNITDELGYSSNLASDLFTFKQILYGWDFKFSIPIHCGFFSISLFNDFRFLENLKAKEDWIMWLSFFQKNIEVYFLDETLAYYRQHDGGLTRNPQLMISNTIKSLKYINKLIEEREYQQYLLYFAENKIREIEELKSKNNELINISLYSNSSINKGLVRRLRSLFSKLYHYLQSHKIFIT